VIVGPSLYDGGDVGLDKHGRAEGEGLFESDSPTGLLRWPRFDGESIA
jgi:hypothetical protein